MKILTIKNSKSVSYLMMKNNKNKALVACDFSYFLYYTILGCVSEFKKKEPAEYNIWLKPAEETDQENLPNLLNCDIFKRLLKKQVMKRCETIDWLLKSNFQDEFDYMDQVDIVFAMDDYTSNGFRKSLYPAYKGQRKLVKKQFDIQKVKDYVFNVIFKELELEKKYGYSFISVSGAEGDDIIAVLFKNCSDDYNLRVLISSDHDFVQLKGIKQFDLLGRAITSKIGDIEVTPDEYLLGKILLGDTSDNIVNVFKGIGPKKVIKYIKDKQFLKESLKENVDAAKQFILNKKLISFNEIPEKLITKISEKVNMTLHKNDILNESEFENLNWL